MEGKASLLKSNATASRSVWVTLGLIAKEDIVPPGVLVAYTYVPSLAFNKDQVGFHCSQNSGEESSSRQDQF